MLKNINTYIWFKYKWIALLAIIIFMALSNSTISYISIGEGFTPTFFEAILFQMNEKQLVLFPLMYVLLLFTGETLENTRNSPVKVLCDVFLAGAKYLALFLLANLLYCIMVLDTNYAFANYWSFISGFYFTQLDPIAATFISLLLFFLRSCYLLYLISFINVLTQKNHWGFWSAFIISYIDFWLYELLVIEHPLGILPIEHTRIIYIYSSIRS